jgi:predicted aminopeptidase
MQYMIGVMMNKIRVIFSYVPVIFSISLQLSACAFFSGCYSLKQGAALLGLLNSAVPLESLLENGKPEADFAELVRDIRRYAEEELGLKTGKNYTSYVKIDKTYLAAIVSACAADSFTGYVRRFPVVGSLPYKGFFDDEDAFKERSKLEKKGLDVWVRGVDAFSTLGWFTDPLYSYMKNYTPDRLADLIIHESMHTTVFIKGQAEFNEKLAEFVGSEGARLYMESRYGQDSAEYKAMITNSQDSKIFVAFIQELIAELQLIYESNISRDEKLREKKQIISKAKDRFETDYEKLFSGDHYRWFSDLSVNNAYLELYRLYYDDDNYFPSLYTRYGKDLARLIRAAKSIPQREKNPRGYLEIKSEEL